MVVLLIILKYYRNTVAGRLQWAFRADLPDLIHILIPYIKTMNTIQKRSYSNRERGISCVEGEYHFY